MNVRSFALALSLLAVSAVPSLAEPRTSSITDPDTRAWWEIAEHLSSDAMEGRDTGSPGHVRAGQWVAEQFKAAGLKPAGDNGTWFQSFPIHESRVDVLTWAFVFWVSQFAAFAGLLAFMFRVTGR